MKQLFAFLACAIFAIELLPPAFATSSTSPLQKNSLESNGQICDIQDVPIFITTVNTGETLTEEEKESISRIIDSECLRLQEENSVEPFAQAVLQTENFTVTICSDVERQKIYDSPIYMPTLERIQELLNDGVKLNYLNFYLPRTATLSNAVDDTDDPEYWEETYPELQTYKGYKFLYMETSAGIESSEVSPGNIQPSFSWPAIAQKAIEGSINLFVDDNLSRAISAFEAALEDLFDIYENPLTVTYGESEGYIKAKVSGDLYIRTILIRDDLDRIEGYAYYGWGTTECFKGAMRVNAKYPYYKRPSGLYEYRYPSYSTNRRSVITDNFYGTIALYEEIIRLYNNPIGYFTYNEHLDVGNLIASIVD